VLWKAAMPAVLTEVGFLSNASDRAYISSPKGQDAIARSLFEAFRDYKATVSSKSSAASASASSAAPAPAPAPAPAAKPAPAPAPAAKPAAAPAAKPAPAPAPAPASARKTVFRPAVLPLGFYVQLFASHTQREPIDPIFGPYGNQVIERVADGWYKYSLGPYLVLSEAVKARDEAKRGEFKGAFVIALDGDGYQITIDEARRRINY
jgi:N-acetylmuramoyl-L-alanine amidase